MKEYLVVGEMLRGLVRASAAPSSTPSIKAICSKDGRDTFILQRLSENKIERHWL